MKELVAIFLLTMLCTNVTAQEIEVNGWEMISSISQVPSETFINSKLLKRCAASSGHDNYFGVGCDGTMLFSTEGGTRTFTIHCNSSWDISAPSWCQLSETNGYGIKEISVKVKRNSNTTRKVGVITITSNGITSTLDVEQKGE